MLFPRFHMIVFTQLLSNRFSTVSNRQVMRASADWHLYFLSCVEFRELPWKILEYQRMNETRPLPVCCRFYVLTDVHRRHRQHSLVTTNQTAASAWHLWLYSSCCFALLAHDTCSSLPYTHSFIWFADTVYNLTVPGGKIQQLSDKAPEHWRT